jgi:hypothetical protein
MEVVDLKGSAVAVDGAAVVLVAGLALVAVAAPVPKVSVVDVPDACPVVMPFAVGLGAVLEARHQMSSVLISSHISPGSPLTAG